MNPATTVICCRVGACPRPRYEARLAKSAESISRWNGIDCFACNGRENCAMPYAVSYKYNCKLIAPSIFASLIDVKTAIH